jgi:hypothetical protein
MQMANITISRKLMATKAKSLKPTANILSQMLTATKATSREDTTTTIADSTIATVATTILNKATWQKTILLDNNIRIWQNTTYYSFAWATFAVQPQRKL